MEPANRRRRRRRASPPMKRRIADAGSGAGVATLGAVLASGLERPKLLRASERSVRSMVGELSKLPAVQERVVWPKLLRMVERSVRSTWPSSLASPRSSGPMRMELESTERPPKVVKGTERAPLSKTARPKSVGRAVLRMPVVCDFPKATCAWSVARTVALEVGGSTMRAVVGEIECAAGDGVSGEGEGGDFGGSGRGAVRFDLEGVVDGERGRWKRRGSRCWFH